MEGPYVIETFRISDMLASEHISVGEEKVRFVENGNKPSMQASTNAAGSKADVVAPKRPRELLWATGVKLVVLDEHDKQLPTAEFICHFNIDVDEREKVFPEVHTGSNRLFTLTQGQTDFHFPEGYGVPLSSDEFMHIKFQAANRTTSTHRRLKQECKIDFIRESDTKVAMKPLSWYTPFIAVELTKKTRMEESQMHGPSCSALSTGENAPNAIPGSVVKGSAGQVLTGHWKVPPGLHFYTCPLNKDRDFGFNDEDRRVHAVWTHCHPLCKKVTMLLCDGQKKTPLWSVDVSTKTDHGLEIAKINDLYFKNAVVLPKGQQLEIDAVYDNTTGIVQDSMVSQGVFFEDTKFVKPNWKTPQPVVDSSGGLAKECTDIYCGIKSTNAPKPAKVR